ncbi:hypothetical protein HY230_06485 [Candidatus Acetothermia bacterium]|nr:hypothetical protein [Candidatus Acetothermia bacterium]
MKEMTQIKTKSIALAIVCALLLALTLTLQEAVATTQKPADLLAFIKSTEKQEAIAAQANLQVRQIMALSNSTKSSHGVKFVVQGQGIAGWQIQIFSLSGHPVFSQEVKTDAFTWSLTSLNGRLTANGVYLYLITVRGTENGQVHTHLGKLVVAR